MSHRRFQTCATTWQDLVLDISVPGSGDMEFTETGISILLAAKCLLVYHNVTLQENGKESSCPETGTKENTVWRMKPGKAATFCEGTCRLWPAPHDPLLTCACLQSSLNRKTQVKKVPEGLDRQLRPGERNEVLFLGQEVEARLRRINSAWLLS